MVLSQLPREFVQEQWVSSEIDGKPDFTITFPDIGERLVMDAKLTTLETLEPDEKEIRSINRDVVRRADEIVKYITPGVTFPFVLMWTPDSTFSLLEDDTWERSFKTGDQGSPFAGLRPTQ